MKLVAALLLLALSGCATSKVGDLEVLNDMGTSGKQVGVVLRAFDSSCKVLTGHSCGGNINTAQANRALGQAKQLPHVYQTKSVPHILSETQEVLR